MGEKIIEVSASDLIDLGFLVPPYVYMVRNNYSEATTTWSDTYNKQIVNCWPRNYRIKQFAEEFKVSGPANSNDWLSNVHIDETLTQLSIANPGFIHIPYQMRDFQKQRTELAIFDFAKAYKSGMKTFGCVLNTDSSRGPGEHWYCLFGDFTSEPIRIEYFNSTGDYPQSEVHDWLTKLQYRLQDELKKKVEIITVMSRGVQQNSDDCGVYCLYYIWSRLGGVSPSVFSDPLTAPNDSLMKEARKFFFIA
jgi:hypothetical protein